MKFTLRYQISNVCLSLYVSSETYPGCWPPVARAGTGSSPPHDPAQGKGQWTSETNRKKSRQHRHPPPVEGRVSDPLMGRDGLGKLGSLVPCY